MSVRKGNRYPVGSKIGKSGKRVGSKARFRLLTIRDDRRTGLLKALDRILDRAGIGAIERRAAYLPNLETSYGLQQGSGAGNAAYRFRQHRHAGESIVQQRSPASIERLTHVLPLTIDKSGRNPVVEYRGEHAAVN